MLADVNYIDLFGAGYTENAVKLIETVKKVMGLDTVDAATVRTAVDEADADARPGLLRRLTKDMVLNESRRIELDDLVTQEVSRILTTMRDTDVFPHQQTPGVSFDDAAQRLAEIATQYWQLVEPFCWSLQVAARWGSPETLGPWIRWLERSDERGDEDQGGLVALADLRDVPVLASVLVAALASGGDGRWDNFNALLVENTVADPNLPGKRVAIIEAFSPYHPFSNAETVANALARSSKTGDDFATAVADFTSHKYAESYTPTMNWMFALLRPVFNEQFPDDGNYEHWFDYAEVALGVVNEDSRQHAR